MSRSEPLAAQSVRRVGLIINDGKPLALSTAERIETRLRQAGLQVLRASSSSGVVGFANPDQHLRSRGYEACVPPGSTMGNASISESASRATTWFCSSLATPRAEPPTAR